MDFQLRKVKSRRAQRVRRMLCAGLVVWGILGLVGLFTVLGWLLSAVTGRGDRAYGRGVGVSAEAGKRPGAGSGKAEGEDGSGEESSAEADADGDATERYQFSGEERAECQRLYRENQKLLVLVNKETELDEDFDPSLRSICSGRLQASDWLYRDLVDMLAAASDAGYSYWIASAHRSRLRQQALIDEDVQTFMGQGMSYSQALEKTLTETMPAGHSEHETGLALDILCSGNERMDVSQEGEPGNRWMAEHCAEYGFILRYPKEKEEITGIAYEPWHFRYVGREAAEFIMERGITLEEFHGILSSGS